MKVRINNKNNNKIQQFAVFKKDFMLRLKSTFLSLGLLSSYSARDIVLNSARCKVLANYCIHYKKKVKLSVLLVENKNF